MTLLERLAQELKSALLARDAERLSTLRLLKSAVGYAQIERKTETLPDAEVVAIIHKEVKKRREAVEQYDKGGRPELAAKESREITVLESFLPRPLSSEELEQLVRDAIQETGAELQCLSVAGYDATTFGNHEFDFGPGALARAVAAAHKAGRVPPVLAANTN